MPTIISLAKSDFGLYPSANSLLANQAANCYIEQQKRDRLLWEPPMKQDSSMP